ncbi:MAG: peptidase [Proteobacteria bacterium]|nr:peptidase [Pseudomonadota bacterium]
MPVSHEIKSQLAKLLATEDLVVEHKKVATACFNVHTRVLTLPLWEKASNTVYDLLVGHEVGHALFTPDEDWTEKVKVPVQFVNVVEDARIEKLMKRKYLGLAKTFFNGYKELNEEDFFQLEDEKVGEMNLADRANLWFKVGNFIDVPIKRGEEMDIINKIAETETFDDVLFAAEALYQYCKKEKEQEQKVSNFDNHETQGNSTSSTQEEVKTEESDTEEDGEKNKPEAEQSGNNELNPNGPDIVPNDNKEPEVKTADNLEDKIRDLVNDDGYENVYVEIPQVNLETIIGKNEEVHTHIDASFHQQQKSYEQTLKENYKHLTPESLFLKADTEFKKFKVSAQKEVNYLVKEFECRKAADSYSRASIARTGVLDTARLHTYKYNEDLFKKVSIIPDGKNHGLVFILDWSGSMSQVLTDTCKQLFNLIWFCKKVAIPFEVYAFTNEWRRGEHDYATGMFTPADRTSHYEKKENLLAIDESFSLMNILTSKVSGKELEHQMLNIWRLAVYFGDTYQTPYTYPNRMSLSGTPLNEALVSLHQILPKFQRENKLQKVQCIVLTDGEASHLPYHREVKRAWESEPFIGTRHINPHNTFLRDRKLGTTYKFDYGYHEFTDTLLHNLKDKFPSVNFIGIRVLESRNANRFIHLYHNDMGKEYQKIQNDWKKLRSFTITNSGYDAYFGLSATELSQDAEFDVAEDATKSQIKSAFVKSLKTKKLNKKLLGEFISLVA